MVSILATSSSNAFPRRDSVFVMLAAIILGSESKWFNRTATDVSVGFDPVHNAIKHSLGPGMIVGVPQS